MTDSIIQINPKISITPLNHFKNKEVKCIHFLGISGIGMSALATIAYQAGFIVSGSDLVLSDVSEALKNKGIKVFQGHDKSHVELIDLLVITAASNNNNPEIIEAQQKNIPILTRSEFLAHILKDFNGIAITGTHGKTTTSSMLAHSLKQCQISDNYIVGGQIKSLDNQNAHLGLGNLMVLEACESEAGFLKLYPEILTITNIDFDHLNAYDNSKEKFLESLILFTQNIKTSGLLVLNNDCPNTQKIMPKINKKYITFGFNENSDFQAKNIKYHGFKTSFEVIEHNNNKANKNYLINLQVPGKHNVLNALCAITILRNLGLDIKAIQEALQLFTGSKRRFDTKEMVLSQKKITLINDYGHHPAEIKATLETIKDAFCDKKLLYLYQPHRFSRTKAHFDEFIDAFLTLNENDHLILLKTYYASEKEITGAKSIDLIKALEEKKDKIKHKNFNISYYDNGIDKNHIDENLINLIKDNISDDGIILVQGAGDIGYLYDQIASFSNNL